MVGAVSYVIGLTHTIDAAHRVVGHEGGMGKCARLHGHTYTFDVELEGDALNDVGFVVDFGVIKRTLDAWDHRCLLWERDPLLVQLMNETFEPQEPGIVRLPFNPTAENLARYIAEVFTQHPNVDRARVTCRETAKSSATWEATS